MSQHVLGTNAHSGDGICFHAFAFLGEKMCLSEMQMFEQSCRDCEKETLFKKKKSTGFFFYGSFSFTAKLRGRCRD